MLRILKRFQNKTVVISTTANIIAILTLLNVIDNIKADMITKVVGLNLE